MQLELGMRERVLQTSFLHDVSMKYMEKEIQELDRQNFLVNHGL